MSRRRYLDWLRGIAVLIMIEAHTIDSWTLDAERARAPFANALILGGFGAPVFLFLAGIAIALAAGGRVRGGTSVADASAAARRRGWQIFGLAFLFRLQSWILGGGAASSLLKIDILNIMGLAMVGAASLWRLATRHVPRTILLAAATVGFGMVTPIVRAASWPAVLPGPVEGYLRPAARYSTFTLLPWAGFLFAGAALGVWIERARTPQAERRLVLMTAVCGVTISLASYAASFLPPIYSRTNFWTSSPTYFFLRTGVLLALPAIAYAVSHRLPRASAPLEDFGRASLFVYWIHVEMVYGVLSAPIHRRLTFEQALAALVLFSAFLYGMVKLKGWIVASRDQGER